jgi:UDP-N-acetylenolpyruvoylglucosamine reductase
VNELKEKLVNLLGDSRRVLVNEPLAPKTTFGVGGAADYFVSPRTFAELASIVKLCKSHGVNFHILGRGSNTIVRDGGYRGVVIQPLGGEFEKIEVRGTEIECGAAVRLKSLAIEAQRNAISGFEFLEGIPGSVGGALRMNAGAMSWQISDIVSSLTIMNYDGEIVTISKEQAGFSYRNCAVLKNAIALGAVFRGVAGNRDDITKKMEVFANKRFASQPKWRSAGCVFKNPPGDSAGKIIDELGLKGLKSGGAMVSNEHGNFIVNFNKATAKDVLDLIEKVREEVKKRRGIELELEVEVIGEDL